MIDQKLTKSPKEKTSFIMWEGRRIPMNWTPSGWRARSRSAHCTIDFSTNVLSLQAAQAAVREHLRLRKPALKSSATLEDVVTVYRNLPKWAAENSVVTYISRLRHCVRSVLGKELDQVPSTAIDAQFWLAYIAKRQGLAVPIIGRRHPQNGTINSAMVCASALFLPKLRPLYAAQGITFAPDVTVIQWLPRMKLPIPPANEDALLTAWNALRTNNDALWFTVGAAWFCGLRRAEISGFSRSWLEEDNGATYIRIRDRPEDGWINKTGEDYRALVINSAFAAALQACPDGYIVRTPETKRHLTRWQWFKERPCAWLKPFIPDSLKPLHHLRKLYAQKVAKLREDAVTAQLAGERAAADALGHTSTATTKMHYLEKHD